MTEARRLNLCNVIYKEHRDLKDIEGIVIETLPNAIFKIKLDKGGNILGYISGQACQRCIKILSGDVKVDLSP